MPKRSPSDEQAGDRLLYLCYSSFRVDWQSLMKLSVRVNSTSKSVKVGAIGVKTFLSTKLFVPACCDSRRRVQFMGLLAK